MNVVTTQDSGMDGYKHEAEEKIGTYMLHDEIMTLKSKPGLLLAKQD